MLIRFFVENFLSFKEETEFSLIPGRGRLLSDHIIKGNTKKDINILKAALIYGPNSSGKSNLVKAIAFAKKYIKEGRKYKEPTYRKRYKLSKETANQPSKFQFDLKYKGKYYSYGFSVDDLMVKEEWLYEIKNKKLSLIFERKTNTNGVVEIDFANKLTSDKKQENFLNYIKKGTRQNQLFLTETINKNLEHFEDVYEWFNEILFVIFPETQPLGIEFIFYEKKDVTKTLNSFLKEFDTDIEYLKAKKQALDVFPEEIISKLNTELENEKEKIFIRSPDNKRYCIYKKDNNELVALKLMSVHKIQETGEEIFFDIPDESDGTQRIIDLLPVLSDLLKKEVVLIVDELDRSLHPHITKKFFNMFLKNTKMTNSQFMATTHDVTLLDLKSFRKDEIWFIEKNNKKESVLYSLEEFKPRFDKEIQKGYLKGRFGAVPIINW